MNGKKKRVMTGRRGAGRGLANWFKQAASSTLPVHCTPARNRRDPRLRGTECFRKKRNSNREAFKAVAVHVRQHAFPSQESPS